MINMTKGDLSNTNIPSIFCVCGSKYTHVRRKLQGVQRGEMGYCDLVNAHARCSSFVISMDHSHKQCNAHIKGEGGAFSLRLTCFSILDGFKKRIA